MQTIAQLLLDHHAVRVSIDPPFTWTSGIKSPVYCDNRLLTGHPAARDAVVDAFVTKIRELGIAPEVIAGVATGSISWAALVADRMQLPMVFVRGAAKKHGAKKQVEGYITAGQSVLIVEDLFSTGGSSIAAAEALIRECDAEVLGMIAIMSWELPKLQTARAAVDFPLWSLTDFDELIPLAAEVGQIPTAQVDTVKQFRTDPAAWGANL